ncbi:glycosyltransferase involved in cell wall biogenesis [Nocardia seriolae]|nr:glycosyltransferase involved in cell wall biogenesis [Nocardia seriolae]
MLVVAKSPIAGFAKTRLTPPFSPVDAAYLAACALLDTLDAVRESGIRHRVVAWTGDLDRAERSIELAAALRDVTVIPQRGDTFGERLAHAHLDAAEFGVPVLQIGMDTPQADADLLTRSAARLVATGDAVLGPATDGGWWALGVPEPRPARLLADIPMSTARTGELTETALRHSGFRVHALPTLTDVDTYSDAISVAAISRGRFARTVTDLVTAKTPVPL